MVDTSPPPVILAVDSDPAALRLVQTGLAVLGFHVITAPNAEAALRLLQEQRPDVLLMELLLADASGIDLLQQLRAADNPVPVIILSSRDRDQDKVRALLLGADDYLVKPFNLDELGARIRAVLRRSLGIQPAQRVVQAGEVTIDLGLRQVWRAGERVPLTRTEWLVLQQLAANANRVVLNAELLDRLLWGAGQRRDLHYLRVVVSRLRRKLEPSSVGRELITTVMGMGYLLSGEVREA